MRRSRIRAKLSRREPVLLTQLHLTDPSVYELTSLMGFDGIWMDLEHHAHSVETAAGLMRAARVGSADIVARPAKGEFMRLGRLLEAGAQGLIYPRCESADEAAEVVRWAKFAPQGVRGIDGANPDAPYLSLPLTEYIETANRETFIVIQIEDAEALEQAEEIARVPGVDVLMLGPGDFSILGGFPGEWDDPRLADAFQHLSTAARTADIHWGGPCFSIAHASHLLGSGARFLCHHADILMLKQGMEKLQSNFRALGFEFDNRLPHRIASDEPTSGRRDEQ